jgi:hypothetical protein
MYDPLRSTYSFSCPHGQEAHVPLSSFRTLERLPGAAHPAVFGVSFACACGHDHAGLVSHDDLDVAPLGVGVGGSFHNLLTGRGDALDDELLEVAATRIGAGEWPWSFFCYLEARPQPITPSSLSVISPGAEFSGAGSSGAGSSEGGLVGVAARCPSCSSISVNLVTRQHLDIPFWNDPAVAVVDHVFADDAVRTIEEFRSELHSARFDERRLDLER